METALPKMRDRAQRMLAGIPSATATTPVTPAVMATERLKTVVVRFFGSQGYASLLQRALTLSSGETPLIPMANVDSDVHLKDLEQLSGEAGMNQRVKDEAHREAAVATTGHLLSLLVALVGEPHTLRLVREACPDIC